ncbi:MAG: LysR family transcriptional regulator [Caulobacterales bacterium]|nr:LysR family transcriptional regulator [Caulobacterales bacterium]
MELRELRYFLAVFETGSITAAARRCFISQPSISAAIAALEAELGAVLFARHRKGVSPTPAAEQLYVRARSLVDDALALKSIFAVEPAAQVSVGLMRSLDIPRALDLLKPLARELQLSLVEADAPCDLRIIARGMAADDEAFAPLWAERYVVALPPQHELRFKPSLVLADLKGQRMVARCNCENAQATADLGFRPEIAAVATTEEWAIALVEAGVGLTVIPEGAAPANTRVELRPLADLNLQREVGIAYRRADAASPAVAAALALLTPGNERRAA